MGYTFAAALVKKTGEKPTMPATRKALREGVEALGYVKANPEEASLQLPLYHDKKSAWLTIALEMPEDLDAQTELLRKLSAEMHAPILYFMNFDSDFLYVAATDGSTVQHVHVGFIDEDDDAMTDSEDLSVFDALLPDDAARAEFRRILAVDDEERVFSEEAAQEMAALFGYTPEALFVDEDAEPAAVLGFKLPGQEAVPLMMPEDAPPAFTKANAVFGYGNPVCLRLNPCGGAGKGIRVVMKAEGYDAEDWNAASVRLHNKLNRSMGHPAPMEYEAKVLPKRVAFRDGGKGWIVEFPEAPVFRGVNPDSPQMRSARADAIYRANGYDLWLTFPGGSFRHHGVHREEMTHIWIMPMENPKGVVYHCLPRQPLKHLPRWMDADEQYE